MYASEPRLYNYLAKASTLTRSQTMSKSRSSPRLTRISPSFAPVSPSADFHSRASFHDISRPQTPPQRRGSLEPSTPPSRPPTTAKAAAKATTRRKALERPPATPTRSRRGFLKPLLGGTTTKKPIHTTWRWSRKRTHAPKRRLRALRRIFLRRWTPDPASVLFSSIVSRMRASWVDERVLTGVKSGHSSHCRDGTRIGLVMME
jgi:hypothetical protein